MVDKIQVGGKRQFLSRFEPIIFGLLTALKVGVGGFPDGNPVAGFDQVILEVGAAAAVFEGGEAVAKSHVEFFLEGLAVHWSVGEEHELSFEQGPVGGGEGTEGRGGFAFEFAEVPVAGGSIERAKGGEQVAEVGGLEAARAERGHVGSEEQRGGALGLGGGAYRYRDGEAGFLGGDAEAVGLDILGTQRRLATSEKRRPV